MIFNLELRDGCASLPIDWGDGTTAVCSASGTRAHSYARGSTHIIRFGNELKHFTTTNTQTLNKYITGFQRMGDDLESLNNSFEYSAITSVPEWGQKITSAYGAFAICSKLTSIPSTYPPNLRSMGACFMRDEALVCSMPKWPACFYEFTEANPPTTEEELARWNLLDAGSTYYACNFVSVWDTSASDAELMPYVPLSKHNYTVSYCNPQIKEKFLTTWGGTRTS